MKIRFTQLRLPTLGVLLAICFVVADLSAQQRNPVKPSADARTTQRRNRNIDAAFIQARRETINAASLGNAALEFFVVLPPRYTISRERYAVLYLLHGADGRASDWLTRTNLEQVAARFNLIVVLPTVGNSWYANSAGEPAKKYEDAIIKDLIPHVDRRFRTIGNWHARGIAGLSMGGFGAMKFALRYPHLFVFAASFSGAFDAPRTDIVSGATDSRSQTLLRIFGAKDSPTREANDVFLLLEKLNAPRTPYLYLSSGASDPLSSVFPANTRFVEALRNKKLAYEYHELPGSHDWRFWSAEIEKALARMSDLIPQMKK